MEDSNRHNGCLGVNKMGKGIRKTPLQQPKFNNAARQQPQPQVYNISKTDFRNIVQQLTGSPSRHSQEPLPRPPPPKPPSMRLQKIRPPPLMPLSRPIIPHPHPAMPPFPAPATASAPLLQSFHGQSRPQYSQPLLSADPAWGNVAESPISAYMRYLLDSGQTPQAQPGWIRAGIVAPIPTQAQAMVQPQPHSHPRPQGHMQPQVAGQGQMPALLSNPAAPPLPSPRANGPPLLPSPTSQFLLPSPTGFLNMFSPRSPYPLLSPGYQFPPPLTPNFSFSHIGQSGILGPGPQLPPSPGSFFPLSPSGLFPSPHPRWRGQ